MTDIIDASGASHPQPAPYTAPARLIAARTGRNHDQDAVRQ